MWSAALHTARSSACWVFNTCLGRMVVMLLIYRRKSVGEMTPPCGNPSLILTLMYPSSLTLADLSCRKQRIHLYLLPDTQLWSTFSRRPSRHTLSNAFVRSKKATTTFFFWAIRASWSSVLLCFLYPVCVCDRTLLSSKKDSSLLLITFSCIFHKQLRRLIGSSKSTYLDLHDLTGWPD